MSYAAKVISERPDREMVSKAFQLAANGSISAMAIVWADAKASRNPMMQDAAQVIDQMGALRFPHWDQVKNSTHRN